MRFSAVVVLAAGAVASLHPAPQESKTAEAEAPKWTHGPKKHTTSTVYATKTYTVSDCPDTVTNCPYDKTKVVTKTVAVSTTVCELEDEETSTAAPHKSSTWGPKPVKPTSSCAEEDEHTWAPKPTWVATAKPEHPACPSTIVKTITSSYTTVLPTTVVVTETVDCGAEVTKPAGVKPTGGSYTNGSSPAKPTKPVVTAGAGALAGSAAFAAVAGVLAFVFA